MIHLQYSIKLEVHYINLNNKCSLQLKIFQQNMESDNNIDVLFVDNRIMKQRTADKRHVIFVERWAVIALNCHKCVTYMNSNALDADRESTSALFVTFHSNPFVIRFVYIVGFLDIQFVIVVFLNVWQVGRCRFLLQDTLEIDKVRDVIRMKEMDKIIKITFNNGKGKKINRITDKKGSVKEIKKQLRFQ